MPSSEIRCSPSIVTVGWMEESSEDEMDIGSLVAVPTEVEESLSRPGPVVSLTGLINEGPTSVVGPPWRQEYV